MKITKINVAEVSEESLCIAAEDGKKVYDKIKGALDREEFVQLDFVTVHDLTTAFLNRAVGELYWEFEHGILSEHISIAEDTNSWILEKLSLVVKRAKQSSKNPTMHKDAAKDMIGTSRA